MSQKNQCQIAAEAASSFSYHGLHTTNCRATAEAPWSSAEETWPSAGDSWPSPGDTWPSVESAGPSAGAMLFSSYHGLLTNAEKKGKIYNHYNNFFAAREQRQKEMTKVESPQHRQARELRTRNPGVKKATVYE